MWIKRRGRRVRALRRPDGTTVRAGVAVLCVLATVAGLACGDDSKDSASTSATEAAAPAAPTNIISGQEIRAARAGSIDRALLRFFQAVQFQDFQAARELISLRQRRLLGRARLKNVIALVGPGLGKPQVLSVRREGREAVARVLVLGYAAGKAEPSTTSPTTFMLVRRGKEWLVSDLSYLIHAAEDIAQAKAQEAGRGR
jgi:hypothetical protein